jgi:hypothetical protein
MQTQHQPENETLYLYFRDALVGVVENVRCDMGYMEGSWKPHSTAVTTQFEGYLKTLDAKEALKHFKGKLVKWSCQPTQNLENYGLAMCIYNGSIIVRMLVSKESIAVLQKSSSYL